MNTNDIRTADDLISARCCLQVKCRNCGRRGFLDARAIKAMIGHRAITEINFTCTSCGKNNPLLRAAPKHLAEQHNDFKGMAFGGVYANRT